ncbi:MAG TPA: YihY/virulence factor BrkB family protein [Candidatus Saccharimonadales bacterium]|nr:YihY/virulence factor BrkB family protein [Candidatus Saccharimonadales bacterium]
MNALQRTVRRLDSFQQRHRLMAFGYAVIKKYGEDEAGSRAALLTYYGFLSLFPLLLLLTTVTDTVISSDSHLRATIIKSVTDYFPLLGNQLAGHVHGLHRSGLALAAGVLLTFYGARGVADAFRKGVQHIWEVPEAQRDGFPKSLFKTLSLLIVGAVGFVAASVLAGLTAAAGHSLGFRVLSALLNMFVLFWVFNFLLDFSLPRHLPLKQTQVGAASAAIGLVVLQSLGGYVVARELKNLDALYSYFALTLGLLFWIYLLSQILYYSMEIAFVHSHHLWPRNLDGSSPTPVDKRRATEHAEAAQ